MSNLIAFHGYNWLLFTVTTDCFSWLQLIHLFGFSFFPFPTFWFSRFHLLVLRFQLLFWILTVASLCLPSSPHIYINTNVSWVVQLRYPYIFFCALLFCLMVSFFLSTFVSAYFICRVDGFIFVRVLNCYCWTWFL